MNARATPTAAAKPTKKAQVAPAKSAVPEDGNPSWQATDSVSAAATRPDSGLEANPVFMEPGQRRAMIAEAAYYRAERRGFEPGREFDDWCLAEGEIDGMLTRGEMPAVCDVTGLT